MCFLWQHHRGQCPKNTCCMESQSHERLRPPLLKPKFGNGWLTNAAVAIAKNSIPVFNSNSNSRVFHSNSILDSTNFNSNSNSNSGIWICIFIYICFAGWYLHINSAPKWMMQDRIGDKSAFVLVMTWCHQATSNYLSQYWSRSHRGVTKPQFDR